MKRYFCALFLIAVSQFISPMSASAADYAESRIVEIDDFGRPVIMVEDGDPTLWTLSSWYGVGVEDFEGVNFHGYNIGMTYTLPIQVIEYEIEKNIGVYGIAARYDVTEASIQHLNGLEDVTDIKAGDILYIPRLTTVVPESQSTTTATTNTNATSTTTVTTANTQVVTTQSTTAQTTTTQQTTTGVTTNTTQSTTQITTQATTVPANSYKIKDGDSLDMLASKFGTTRAVLMKLNPWIEDPNFIVVGKWLKLPESSDSTSIETNVNQDETGVHIVQEGEFLSTIAAKYNTTVSALLKINPEITNPNLIRVNQKIRVSNSSNSDVPPAPIVNSPLPEEMWIVLQDMKKKYPTMRIGVGLYTPDCSYTYNANEQITGCCTIKASYALFVLKKCIEDGIDIYNTKLTYRYWHYNAGSGTIKNSADGTNYTIYELLNKLITISDNSAYNVLTSRFSMSEFYEYNRAIGGQSDGKQYGAASVKQRYAEWNEIIKFINSDAIYADELYYFLDVAKYGYLEQGMISSHNVLHKSGWSSGNYNGAADVAWIDGKYLLIVMTDDNVTDTAHTDVVRAIGGAFDRIY